MVRIVGKKVDIYQEIDFTVVVRKVDMITRKKASTARLVVVVVASKKSGYNGCNPIEYGKDRGKNAEYFSGNEFKVVVRKVVMVAKKLDFTVMVRKVAIVAKRQVSTTMVVATASKKQGTEARKKIILCSLVWMTMMTDKVTTMTMIATKVMMLMNATAKKSERIVMSGNTEFDISFMIDINS